MEARDTIIDGGERIDAGTGEVLDRVAADGRRKMPAATSFADFLRMLEEGQFDADLHAAMQDLAATMIDHYSATRAKAKGKLKIEIDFGYDGIFRMASKFDVKKPVMEREPSILFANEDNRFTPHRPGQGDFFGVRDVSSPATFRDA